MDFHDFPMFVGNLGVETDHPPKMCAGLPLSVFFQVDMDALGTTATDGATTGQSISIQFKEKTKAHTDENLSRKHHGA